jgi:hypothetical protein
MTDLEKCSGDLRRLIEAADTKDIPVAERSINEYLANAPIRTEALRNVQQVIQLHREGASGDQRDFAEVVNDYIEKLMRSFE